MSISKDAVVFPFIKVDEDANGVLKNIEFTNDDNFNFAFDIVDKLAKKCPDKRAMLHISKDGKERS
ncbi:MAG: acetyl-CoA synthetase, partial [Eubacterium sp.]|nr:acetyl-CoA synthetase [Eubacterium sp.]